VEASGIAEAAVLFETDSPDRRLALADLRFAADGKQPAELKITELGPLPAAPVAAAAGYVVSANGAPRRDWAVLLEDGTVVHSGNPGNPQRLAERPAVPLELVPLASSAYLLTVDGSGQPGFTLLQ
jgi:cell division septal protein FtsQ